MSRPGMIPASPAAPRRAGPSIRLPVGAAGSALGLAALLLVTAPAFGPARAQSDGGGVALNLRFDQSLTVNDNAGLDVVSDGTTITALSRVNLGYSTATRISRFALNGALGLRAIDRPDTSGLKTESTTPTVSLSYGRDGIASSLDLGATFSVDDIEFLNPLDLIDEDGLPIDFEDLTGTGTRRSVAVNGSLSLRDDAPFGVVLSFSHSDLSYSDVTDPDLVDSSRTTLGATARLDLTEAARANLGLTYSRFDEVGEDLSETVTLNGSVSIDRPDGSYGFGASATDTENGTRYNVRVNRTLLLPNGSLSGNIGVSRSVQSDYFVTGALAYNVTLPQGRFGARLERSVNTTSSDGETVRSVVSLNASRELTPRTNGSLGLSYASSEDTATGDRTEFGSVSASIGFALSEDWRLNTSLRHEFREQTGTGRADANVLSLSLGRNFDWRF